MSVKIVLVKVVLLGFLAVLVSGAARPQPMGRFLSESQSGRVYRLYVPTGYTPGAPVPLFVMLHGCSQTAASFASATQMNQYAESETFIVLYPQQSLAENISRCWNWYLPAHQSRGGGEAADVANLINTVKAAYTIDENQVFVAGFSSGGAFAVTMGAAYPDLIAGIAIHSGLEYKAATNLIDAFLAMSSGGPNPDNQGLVAYQAMGSYAQRVPTIVFHGDFDFTVNTVNGHQTLTQWAQTNDLVTDGVDNDDVDNVPEAVIPGSVPGGRDYTEYLYEDSNGALLLKKVIVQGMGHAWSGGRAGGSYTDPDGPDASGMLVEFFLNGQ